MKIEIDLNEILGDEYGSETLQESVRRQVVEKLTNVVANGIGNKIDDEIAKLIDTEIRNGLKDKMPSMIEDVFSTEYFVVDEYGRSSGKKTTFRNAIIEGIQKEMTYKKESGYGRENVFTSTINKVVQDQVCAFKADFNKTIEAEFTREALKHATEKLKKTLGITA